MQDIESFAVNRTLEEMKENARKKEMSLFNKILDENNQKSLKKKQFFVKKITNYFKQNK